MEDDLRKKRFYRNTMLSLNNAKAILRDLQSKFSREEENISELKQIIYDIDKLIITVERKKNQN